MSDSDKIALAALIVAFVGTLGNFWYTRRQFAAANNPFLLVTWNPWIVTNIKFDGVNDAIQQTKFYVRLKNQSSSVSVSDVEVTITLSEPGRYWFSGQSHQAVYSVYRLPDLPPLKEEAQSRGNNPGYEEFPTQKAPEMPPFEKFLAEKMPEMLQKIPLGQLALAWRTNERGYSPAEKPSDVFYYQVNLVRPVMLSLVLRYTPAVAGAKRQVKREEKIISPIAKSFDGHKSVLIDWKIQKSAR